MAMYDRWRHMMDRCYREGSQAYANYGGRGIEVCERWWKFENFVADMGEAPRGKTLERRNNDEGYSKDNCYWASRYTQNQNRRLDTRSSHGIAGVRYDVRGKWAADGVEYGAHTHLYWGNDFFEACCARKSWEARSQALVRNG